MTLRSRTIVSTLAILCAAGAAQAQRNKKDVQEFTKQGLVIVNFTPGTSADFRLGRKAADAVRGRVDKLVNHREVEVVDGGEVRYQLEKAGYNPDTAYGASGIRAIGRFMRADEFVIASVSNQGGVFRLSGQLALLRDEKLRQPLPDATSPKLDSAAQLFARSLAGARSQLVYERRCENALREGSAARAIAAAREGIAAFPMSTIARTCLVWALRQNGTPATEVLAVAREILAVDSISTHAIEAAAVSLDSLKRRDEAADMWFRLAATDSSDMGVATRVIYSLLDGGNARRAEPYVDRLSAEHPDDIQLLRQAWRAAYETKHWTHAIAAGEALLARDSVARSDSVFYLRLATAYHSGNKPYKAIETLAHGVGSFPNDSRLYSLYTQYIRAEADTVVPRGIALFPRSADLVAINAKDLRARGKIAESLDATKQAVALDSTMTQGRLMVAQLEIELGRPDTALATLHVAVAGGEDRTLVSQFALSKGNTLYRAANATKSSADFSLALRFLNYSDSLLSTPQSKFLSGAAALGVAQSALTEASKTKDKTEGCRLSQLGSDMLPTARSGLQAGQEMFGDAAKQSLDYLEQFEPYVRQALAGYCKAGI